MTNSDDEEFHDSLDRILSSSCSSTSASASDDEPPPRRRRSKYKVWISPPSPVADRRRRFLQRMGLLPGSPDDDDESDEEKFVDDSERFTIKNLDSGERFVVKEVREDGTWEKLREVETGRQLTMEEFTSSVIGLSPIVQELMRRQSAEEDDVTDGGESVCPNGVSLIGDRWMMKKKGSLLRTLKTVVKRFERRRNSVEIDNSNTDDSQNSRLNDVPRRIKVRQCGSSTKNLSALFMSQEIQAHVGSIWSVKFSIDGRYIASAGEDRVIRVWEVIEKDMKEWLLPDIDFGCFSISGSRIVGEKIRGKGSVLKKSLSFEQILVPEFVFALSDKPVRSFHGHLNDVLDLSWSKSEYVLSSSMDKTVRLWHISCNACLKVFAHSDYVTCIQFNPINDNYFISGSLDAKVRIWSIEDRQVVNWSDLREMITAVCYRPDGQAALVGSHKGGCYVYDTSENKLHRRAQISLRTKKKSYHKKITGFQFAPGSSSEVLITSADSRIRVVNGLDLVYKFRGIRNTSSQIAASFTDDGEYVISPSEDSHVCVWKYDGAGKRRGNSVGSARTYEYFPCRDVTAAVPWSGPGGRVARGGRRHERTSATWPEEKLGAARGMVIVTASRSGEMRAFQNFGSRQQSVGERK